MLEQETESKKLGCDHIFYKCLKSGLQCALSLSFIPSKPVRDVNKAGYSTRNSIIKNLLVTFLAISKLQESAVKPLLDIPALKLIPISLATDGLSLKPGLQFDS